MSGGFWWTRRSWRHWNERWRRKTGASGFGQHSFTYGCVRFDKTVGTIWMLFCGASLASVQPKAILNENS